MKFLKALLIIGFISGCSNPDSADFPSGVLKYDDSAKDIHISVDPHKETSSLSPQGHVNTAELFEHFYILQALGERTSHSYWARDSQTNILKFYDEPSTHSEVAFSESPYAEIFTASSQAEYMKATDNLEEIFQLEKMKLSILLVEMGRSRPAATEAMSLSEAMQAIVDFMNHFEAKLLKSIVDDSFKMALLAGIYEEFWLKLPATNSIINQLETSADFEAAVATLKGLISTMDIELTQDEAGQIEAASQIGPLLNNQRLEPKHVFNIIVRLWDLMDDEERHETFGEVSPELYDYLNDKSRKGIECLKKRDCRTLVDRIAEKWVIAPEIKKYGVDKLRKEIEESAVSGLKELTAEMATDLIQELPMYLSEAIDSKMDAERDSLMAIRAEYPDYVKREVQKWYEDKFERSNVPALEQKQINIKSSSSFQPQNNSHEMVTSADTLGTALMASAQMFRKIRSPLAKEKPEALQVLGLTRIGQLLAHSGFNMADGKAFKSLSRAFKSGEPFNIEAGFDFPSLFAMQSHVRVKKGFDVVTQFAPSNWNVISQSRLLMGFSHKMDNFKDWEDNSPMDKALGEIQAKDLLPGIPSDELATSAFPEEAFLALSFGNAAAILNNMKTTGTPLFIMCQGGEVLWADSKVECLKASALAGIVNIRNRNREKNVKLMEQAKFLEAVIAFLQRSDVMVRRTQSEYLTSARNGSSAIQDFQDAYPELRNLAMALTNFIVSQFQNKFGEFGQAYSLSNREKALTGKANFDEHLQGIRALVASAEYFQIGPYKRAAVRAYFGLNNAFYNPTTQFYKTGDAQVTSMDLARTLETLERLEQLEGVWANKDSSRNQLNSLLEAWRNSLRPKSI